MNHRFSRMFVVALALAGFVVASASADGNRSDPDFQGTPVLVDDGGDTCPPGVIIAGSLPFMDSGDTCGNTNTVSAYGGTCGLPFSYAGEDQIYEITLGVGNNVGFSADLTGSSGDLALFLIGTCGTGTSCVANSQDAIGPGAGPEDIAAAAYTPGTYFLYVDSYYDAGTAGSCGTFDLTVSGTLPVELMELSID